MHKSLYRELLRSSEILRISMHKSLYREPWRISTVKKADDSLLARFLRGVHGVLVVEHAHEYVV